jgi:hypothetical protein
VNEEKEYIEPNAFAITAESLDNAIAAARDIRGGMTSASNAQADRLCPGRHLAQRGAPKEIESDEASLGTLMHAVFAGLEPESKLDSESLKTVRRAKDIESQILGTWLIELNQEQPATCHREDGTEKNRMWATRTGQRRHSGLADCFWRTADGMHALLEDYKSLWGDIPDASVNEQLRDLACMIWKTYGVETVTAFINQPRVTWRVADVRLVKYEREDLVRAYSEMMERVEKSNDIRSPRIVGSVQCKYCRAAGTSRCPESQKALVAIGQAQFDIEHASPAERGDWLEKLNWIVDTAEKGIEQLKQGIRENGEGWAEGWGFGKAKRSREIDTQSIPQIGASLSAHFDQFQPAQLAACCKLSVPKLEQLHAKLSGLSGKQAFDHFEQLFGELIETKEQQQPIQRIK